MLFFVFVDAHDALHRFLLQLALALEPLLVQEEFTLLLLAQLTDFLVFLSAGVLDLVLAARLQLLVFVHYLSALLVFFQDFHVLFLGFPLLLEFELLHAQFCLGLLFL